MKIGLGIDTGGTYTDAVIYSFDENKVLAKNKSLTTKEDLSIGIKKSVSGLPNDLLAKAEVLSVSTTLATNACVENKGGRAKLVLMGTNEKTLKWIDATSAYGIKEDARFCVDIENGWDEKHVGEVDWESITSDNQEWFSDAQALAVVAKNAVHNGGAYEKSAESFLSEKYKVPFITANEIASNINMMERGATALLNARLLPVMEEFMIAVGKAFDELGLNIKKMVVRSDGSLMSEELLLKHPVKTILSGPAASVLGANELSVSADSLIVDMGGTTTDISIVKNSKPVMTNTISIGGYKTQIKGVYIDTFSLGGDTRVLLKENKFVLDNRKVEPLSSLAVKYPQIKEDLKWLVDNGRLSGFPIYEFLYLVKKPSEKANYSGAELSIVKALEGGPLMLGKSSFDLYSMNTERLEAEGIVMRSGLTPTDIMHIKGDFTAHDKEAAELGARYLLNNRGSVEEENEEELAKLCDEVYDLVCKTLYENIVITLLQDKYPNLFEKGMDPQILTLISENWSDENHFFGINYKTRPALIGVGAPIHVFLPRVAKVLNTECIVPEHAEVANAVGAIVADISVETTTEIAADYSEGFLDGYIVYTDDGNEKFDDIEQAREYAKDKAGTYVKEQARLRGALGELSVVSEFQLRSSASKDGSDIDLGALLYTVATGRV